MQQLTNAEEQLMEHLWAGESLYEDLLRIISRTKAKTTTVGHFTETHD
jgi:predicted transcriptional regulator